MTYLTRPQVTDSGTVEQLQNALCARYPCFRMWPIGRSALGKTLRAVVLGDGDECVLMAAAFHGQEWMTALVCLRLCEEIGEALISGYSLEGWDLRRALCDRQIVWVPLVNPDGADIAIHGSGNAGRFAPLVNKLGGDEVGRWQANARGVDLNHNFNAGWDKLQQAERKNGIVGPAARQWGGPHPHSEPETVTMVALCDRLLPRHAVALHSQGEEIYWQYGVHTPPKAKLMADAMAAVSGYIVSHPTGLASHGGFKDWFIETYRKPAFTIELGKGVNPLPLNCFEATYRKAREMLILSLLL